MELRTRLIRAIERSEAAYSHYLEEKRYYQALRIKKANEEVYRLLQEFYYECNNNEVESVRHYIFHLNDWLAQFEQLESTHPSLDSEFIFTRFRLSFSYPKDFKTRIQIK